MLYAESGKMFTFSESHLEVCFSAFLALDFKAAWHSEEGTHSSSTLFLLCLGKPRKLSCSSRCRRLDVGSLESGPAVVVQALGCGDSTQVYLHVMLCCAELTLLFLAVCLVVLRHTEGMLLILPLDMLVRFIYVF